jgi:fumarate hydratase class I
MQKKKKAGSLASTLKSSFIEIIRKTSSELPDDVVRAIQENAKREEDQSRGRYAMDIIQKNVHLAKLKSQPLCQDTGSILFFINYPSKVDQTVIEKAATQAVKAATAKGYLRQNSVDSITGKNSGNNVGPGTPTFHFHPWKKDTYDIRLILKGGGCENVGAQYSLPDTRIGAGRDLEGVRKCILDAVTQAQGKGCGPGILGVTIGGDRATGYLVSKEQFLRTMGDKNRDDRLGLLEKQIVEDANKLGIGPMGFGGKTTLLGCKITALNRLPASFFVSVSYMCWAYRRQGAMLSPKAEIKKWVY